MLTTSRDGTQIYYEVSGDAGIAVVFVHGWRGNARWWDAQRDALAGAYRVVALDLAGHGQSGPARMPGSAEAYAEDVVAVVRAVAAPRVVLVGHSMSGAYVLLAAAQLPEVERVILVDTLKDVAVVPDRAQLDAMFAIYRADFAGAVANVLPRFLYAPETPAAVRERLAGEFLAVSGDVAVALLEPLYRCDLQAAARGVTVPVRGIGSSVAPDTSAANRAYFADYTYRALAGCGHYPMLEVPDAFLAALRAELPV